jgi:hypothetical protein
MNALPSRTRPALAAIATAVATLLAGCITIPAKQVPAPASAPTPAVRPAQGEAAAVLRLAQPRERAERTVTGFTPALRCLDEKLFRAGVRDLTLVLDDVRDATQRVPVGAREMMTSAFSEMTRRSRAVRLSLIGGESGGNLLQALQQAKEAQVFSVLPEYTLRGSLSQLDEDVERRTSGIGVTVPLLGLKLGSEKRFSVMGLDAALLRTDSQTLVPGVTSRNTTVLRRQDSGVSDGQATLRSTTATFALATARSEGVSQATRAMVELAALELVGKLTRLPYWQCLGTTDDEPEVRREVEDWFTAMDEGERIAFVKERLRERRWYDGAIDDRATPEFTRALAAYRQALGQAPAGPIDLEFFRRFIVQAPVDGPLATARRAPPAAELAPGAASSPRAPGALPAGRGAPAAAAASAGPSARVGDDAPVVARPAAAAQPLPLRLQPVTTARGFALVVQPRVNGYAYCYAQDPATQALRRVFPNRFQRDPRVEAGQTLVLPGRAGFVLSPSHRHACVFATREVYGDLPAVLRWGDFQDVRARSFAEIQERFRESTDAEIVLVEAGETPVVAAGLR